jgi:hypothetical protein
MAQKITTNQLKRIIKRFINESDLRNEYFEFNSDEDSDSEEKFNKSEDLGFKKDISCKNGMVWGSVRNLKALSKNAQVAIPITGSNDIVVLMDGDNPKAVAQIDWKSMEIKMVRAKHNAEIEPESEIGDCVKELGASLGRTKASNLLKRGGM